MTNAAWVKGFADLSVLPDSSPVDETFRDHRARIYRQQLNDLTDQAWLHAVSESIRGEKWFPPVAVLREYAEAFRSPYKALPPARSDNEREAGRAAAVEGVKLCREAWAKALIQELNQANVKQMLKQMVKQDHKHNA